MRTFQDAEARLAEALPGYESREPQQRLARAVEAVFANQENFALAHPESESQPVRRHLIAQAGCGTGKSLGYAIPSILAAVNDRRRVVVTVTTKALQDQLASKDMPFLQEHLGVPFSWMVLKGRSNYLCLNRALEAESADVPLRDQILAFAKDNPGFSGERSDVPFEIPDGQWWRVASEADECKDLDCKEVGGCYAEDARVRARASQIVIVNHSLFFTDLAVRSMAGTGMLGEYDLVVFDEAHEAEDVAGNTLGSQFSERTYASMNAEIRNWATRYCDEGVEAVMGPVTAVAAASTALFAALEPGRLRERQIDEHVDLLGALYDAISGLREALASASYEDSSDPVKAKRRKDALLRRVTNQVDRFGQVIAADHASLVRWVEVERRNHRGRTEEVKVIKTAPVDVAPYLRENLFSRVPTVLVSATLAVKGNFDYIAGRMGIDSFDGLDVGTPFDFASQARLFVPTSLPEPVRANVGVWQAMATEVMVDLIKASKGRTLVLFTSVAHMRQVFANLERRLPYTVRMQGQQGWTNKALAEWFKEDTHGVLLGTRSFFTGFDIQGESLSTVIIAKMPFPVPDEPLFEARCEAVERRGGNAFGDYTIPVMSLVLQQAAGRLIRHRQDKGTVAILDPRILTKGYGKQIVRDLPPMPVTTSMPEVEAWMAEVDAHWGGQRQQVVSTTA